MSPWPILVALVAVLLAGVGGYWRGYHDAVIAATAARAATMEAAHKATLARQAADQRLVETQKQLEDAAHAESVRNPECLPRSRVQRLNRYQLPAPMRGAGGAP